MRILIFLFLIAISARAQKPSKESIAPSGEDILTEGLAFFITENYNNALRQFESLVKIDENSAVGFYMKARTEKQLNQNIQAELSAEKSVSLDKNNIYYWLNYAEILQANNNIKGSQEAYKRIIQLNPEKSEYYFTLSNLQLEANQPNDALSTLNKAEKIFGASDKITEAKQAILIKENKLKQAIREGDKQIDANPEFVLNQSKILIENQQFGQAQSLLEKSLADNPGFSQAIVMLAEVFRKQNDKKGLKGLSEKILEDSSIPFETKAEVMTHRIALKDSGNIAELNELLSDLKKISNQYPEQYGPLISSGEISVLLNDKLAADNYFTEALKKFKNNYDLWLSVIELKFKLGNITQLGKQSDNASVYFPNHPELWFYLSLAQLINGNTDDAQLSLEEFESLKPAGQLKENGLALSNEYARLTQKSKPVAENPKNEFVQLFQGIELMESNPANAVKIFSDLSNQKPDYNLYKFYLSQALLKDKKNEYALKIINEVKEDELQVSALGLEIKGDILQAQNNPDQAKEYWQKALNLDKNNNRLKQKLKS